MDASSQPTSGGALTTAVVSIFRTRRRRFAWAAWWSAPPCVHPFRRPDAHGGGAKTHPEALADAERAAGRALSEIEPRWARAWARVLQGEPPWLAPPSPSERPEERDRVTSRTGSTGPRSVWAVLELTPGAPVEDIKRAFRRRALLTHPDHGGDPAAFRELQRAYTRALELRARGPRRRRR